MILTQPVTPAGIPRVKFDIQRIDYAAPEASGRQGGVQAGFPLWTARFEIDRIDPVSSDLWQAFLDRMRGRGRRFYGCDPTRRFPRAYAFGFAGLVRAGTSTAFTGAATSWSQAITATGDAQLTLGGLPEGFVINIGDYVGFRWDAAGASAGSFERRTLSRAVLPATANASGVAVITAEPPLDTALVPPAAIAHFDNPVCVMQLVTEDSALAPIGAGGVRGGGTIVAVQDLRP